MERKEAVIALIAAGKASETEAVVKEVTDEAQRSYAAIAAEERLTIEARNEDIERSFQHYNDKLTTKLVDMAMKVESTDRVDAGYVYGTKGLDGDPASLTISMRDAKDRLSDVTNREELSRLLEQATRSGDEILARAVVARAIQGGHAPVVNAYIAARPSQETMVERLWKRERANDGDASFRFAVLISGLKPSPDPKYGASMTVRPRGGSWS